jgi:hypothetical protein
VTSDLCFWIDLLLPCHLLLVPVMTHKSLPFHILTHASVVGFAASMLGRKPAIFLNKNVYCPNLDNILASSPFCVDIHLFNLLLSYLGLLHLFRRKINFSGQDSLTAYRGWSNRVVLVTLSRLTWRPMILCRS